MYIFIVNPKSSSGKGLTIWNEVVRKLQEEKVIYQVYFTAKKGDATRIATKVCNEEYPCTVVAVGGDGTVNEVIDGITHLDEVLFGYIPTGSANDTVRGLELKKDPLEALQAILHPEVVRKVDIGTIVSGTKEHRFMVSAGMGYDAEVCEEAFRSGLKKLLNKIKLGKLTYFFLAVKKLVFLHTFSMTYITDEDEAITYPETVFIVGMNLKYEGGGLKLCPDADCSDGLLDLCIVEKMQRARLLCILPLGFQGKHTRFQGIHIVRCKKVMIHASKPVQIHTDGEDWGKKNFVEMTTAKEQLSVIM